MRALGGSAKRNFPRYPREVGDLLDDATVTCNGKEIEDLDELFTCICQDLNGTLPNDGYVLEYNRVRAARLWQEHRETLDEIWRGLYG